MTKRKSTKAKKKQPIRSSNIVEQNRKESLSLVWIFAAVVFVIALFIKTYAIQLPVMGDEASYYILGKKAIGGAALYRDIYEMKPPLLFYTYGINSLIFGWSSMSLRLAGLTVLLINAFLFYKVARLFTTKSFSFLIAGLNLFLMNNVFSYATETTSEHYLTTFLLSGFYILIKPKFKKTYWNLIIAGFLICGAAMIKQTAALYGLGALIVLVVLSFNKSEFYSKEHLVKNIALLATGAIAMLVLNLIPILIFGTLSEAKYWLLDVPFKYSSTSEKSLADSWIYLETMGKRVLGYHSYTSILMMIGFLSLFINFKRKNAFVILILILVSMLLILPGYRFYGQYWIPLIAILPLTMISLKDLLGRFIKPQKAAIWVGVISILVVCFDTIIHRAEYFEKGYKLNMEKAYSGNFPNIHLAILDKLKEDKKPGQNFIMFGSQPYTYYAMEDFPAYDHIFPRLITRNTPENIEYQHRAFEQVKEGNYDFAMFSFTGIAWRSVEDSYNYLYNESFNYLRTHYEPYIAYNFDEKRYYYSYAGPPIDLFKLNQVVTFKRK